MKTLRIVLSLLIVGALTVVGVYSLGITSASAQPNGGTGDACNGGEFFRTFVERRESAGRQSLQISIETDEQDAIMDIHRIIVNTFAPASIRDVATSQFVLQGLQAVSENPGLTVVNGVFGAAPSRLPPTSHHVVNDANDTNRTSAIYHPDLRYKNRVTLFFKILGSDKNTRTMDFVNAAVEGCLFPPAP